MNQGSGLGRGGAEVEGLLEDISGRLLPMKLPYGIIIIIIIIIITINEDLQTIQKFNVG